MLGLLYVVQGPDKGRSFPLSRGSKGKIGRGKHSSIRLTDPQVSRLHCELEFADDNVVLIDAGSASGTWVNGERITRHELQPGDVVRLGDTHLAFQWATIDERNTETYRPAED